MNERVLERAAKAGRDVCSLERMIRPLGLFEKPAQRWTFDQIHTRLGHSRSTLYCYLKILTDAEILSSLPGVGFTLCRRSRDKVLCIHQEQTRVGFRSTYGRGRVFPLLRGAASRMTLQSKTLTAGKAERVAGRIVFGAHIVIISNAIAQ